MAGNSLFRSEALEHQSSREPVDMLAQVTAPHDWAVLAALAAVCAAILGWAVFGSVERSLRADAALLREGDRRAAIVEVAGRVREVLVVPGDRVEAGAPLARVAVDELDLRLAASRARARLLELEIAAAEPAVAEGLREPLTAARADVDALAALISGREIIASPATGEVVAHSLAPGAVVAPGQRVARIRVGASDAWSALAFVPASAAVGLRPGMSADLLCAGDTEVQRSQVAEVSPRPTDAPEWLQELGFDMPRGHRVRVAPALPASGAGDGSGCELRIPLGGQSPLSLLFSPAGGG